MNSSQRRHYRMYLCSAPRTHLECPIVVRLCWPANTDPTSLKFRQRMSYVATPQQKTSKRGIRVSFQFSKEIRGEEDQAFGNACADALATIMSIINSLCIYGGIYYTFHFHFISSSQQPAACRSFASCVVIHLLDIVIYNVDTIIVLDWSAG